MYMGTKRTRQRLLCGCTQVILCFHNFQELRVYPFRPSDPRNRPNRKSSRYAEISGTDKAAVFFRYSSPNFCGNRVKVSFLCFCVHCLSGVWYIGVIHDTRKRGFSHFVIVLFYCKATWNSNFFISYQLLTYNMNMVDGCMIFQQAGDNYVRKFCLANKQEYGFVWFSNTTPS